MYVVHLRSGADPKHTWKEIVEGDIVSFAIECWSQSSRDILIDKIEEVTGLKDVTDSFVAPIYQAIDDMMKKAGLL